MANEVSEFIPSEATRTGWEPLRDLSYEEYIGIGKQIGKAEAACQWWIGDWYNAGHGYGDHAVACEEAGIDYKRASNCGAVCKTFEIPRRRGNVSFSHHQEIARIDDISTQEKLLDKCEPGPDGKSEIKNVKELRQKVAAFKGLPSPGVEAKYQDYTLEDWAVSMNTMLYVMSFKADFRKASTEDLAHHLLRNIEELASGSEGPAASFREQVLKLKEGAFRVVDALDFIDERPTLEAV